MKYQSNPLLEFFGFPGKPKANTITSKQFDDIVKLNLIVYLMFCVSMLRKYKGSQDDADEDTWYDSCFYQIDRYLKNAERQLITSGLKTFNEDELNDGIREPFVNVKYLCHGGKDWLLTDLKNITNYMSKLQKPNYCLFDLNTIKNHFKLPA